jgi:hypothetical protein
MVDGFDQGSDIGERAAPQLLVGDLTKPTFNHVEPRTRRGGEMQMEAWVTLQPGSDTRMFMGSIVVDDQMQLQSGGHFGINAFEKPNEFLVSVPRHAVSDNSAIEHTEGGEERGSTVALIVVCLASRQSGT